ncbi:MAG: divergent PAP2 family protein [Spirochaetales bacterium]|nr:divergent PAP2 family protein [Spirochaetales bacterium]
MEFLEATFQNPIFNSAFFSWIISQIIKTIISIVRRKPHTLKELLLSMFWSTGGMPSSHSAVVSAITTAIGFKVGIGSPIFHLSFFYAFITIRDALGVRRAAGLQARAFNQLLSQISEKIPLKIKPLKEIHGHRNSEVSVGIFLGFFLAVAFCNL